MYEDSSELRLSFGTIKIKVSVDGEIDRPKTMVDHMLVAATSVAGIEAIQQGLSADGRDGELQQTCQAPITFGAITVSAEIGFGLWQHVPLRKLNSLVFESILPRICQAAAIYIGENQPLTTPQTPLSPMQNSDVLANVDRALELNGTQRPLPAYLTKPDDEPATRESSRSRQASKR